MRKNINGEKYGKLKVLYETEKKNKNGTYYCMCLCECGNKKEILKSSLISGNTKSCGCLIVDTLKAKKIHYKHGDSKTRLHTIWCEIKRRCYCKSDNAYKNYGGRGITICREWLKDYKNFKKWAINNGYDEKLTIDRIDVNGNYEPTNCRWATRKEQNNNRRSNIKVKYNNEKMTLKQVSEIKKIKYNKIYWAYKNKTLWKYKIEIEEV